MTLRYTSYPIASKGLATSFTEAELPDEYATRFLNRFINAAGGAEKRQGIVQYGATIIDGLEITGLHEMMLNNESIIFASANGRIFKYVNSTTWTEVYSLGTSTRVYRSVQMGKKLIFKNGVDRNIYTEDGITFKELVGVIERGKTTSGTSQTSITDSNISNWILDTQVNTNDLVYNKTREAYAVITVVGTASVTHTAISPTAVGIGVAAASASAGDVYEIQDLVELNIIPTGVEDDNVAIAGTDSRSAIVVSAVPDWTKTQIRPGDYIRNTTKGWVTQVTAISTTQLAIVRATASAGDSLLFLKPAMPIANNMHVHFGRLYMIDSRNTREAVVSGPNNPEDMTTDAGTLDSTSISFGAYQPTADRLMVFVSFQRFLALCGLRNVCMFEGTTPIVDVTSGQVDFSVVGLFPQGVISEDGAISIGNDLAYVSVDGVQAISMQGDSSTLGRENLSEALRTTIRRELANTDPSRIFMFHYPRRSWLCLKIGSKLYIYNYTPYFGPTKGENAQFPSNRGSWSVFDGLFAQQRVYTVISDGSLLCAGAGGKVYKFDQNTYDDAGVPYTTEYATGWLSMESKRRSPKIKQGRYIQPVLDAGAAITYTIVAEAGFDTTSSETIQANISSQSGAIGVAEIGAAPVGGTSIVEQKHSLRWRGKEARFTFTTADTNGPDVLSRIIVFYTEHGAR